MVFCIFDKYGIPRAREAFKNLPGASGFVFPEYEPVASHGDPERAQKYGLMALQKVRISFKKSEYTPRGVNKWVDFENVDLRNLNIYNAT